MSFYALGIYFWCGVATLGLTAPLAALAVQFAIDEVRDCLSRFSGDEPVVSSHRGTPSCP